MAVEETTQVSDESKDFLEDAKKGKPRKFAMICKGTEIVSLVVYKKGNVEKYKKEAKQAGKGQFYFGVIDGRGQDLRFVLARADGFDSSPVKTTVLKKFLEESADLKCKPLFEVVDAAPIVLDEDDPLVARFTKLQAEALAACEAHPDRAAEINTLCRQIGGLLDQDQSQPAEAKLVELETLLGGLAAPPVAPPSAPVADAARAAKLAEALKKLKPLLDKVVDAHPNRKGELFASMAQVANEIKTAKYEQATANLVSLGKLLQGLAVMAPAPTETGDPMTAFRERQAALEPQFLAAQRNSPSKATPLGNVWNYAEDQAQAGNFVNADKALARLEQAIRDVLASPPEQLVATGTVQAAKVLLTTWKDGLSAAKEELGKLRRAIRDQVPNADADGIVARVSSRLDDFASDLDQAINGAASQPSEAGPLERARELIGVYRKRLRRDRLIQHLSQARNELATEVNVEGVFLGVFDDLEAALAG